MPNSLGRGSPDVLETSSSVDDCRLPEVREEESGAGDQPQPDRVDKKRAPQSRR